MTDNLRSQTSDPGETQRALRRRRLRAGKRLLLLAGKLGYQTRAVRRGCQNALGAEVVLGTDRCHQLDDPWADGAVSLHFDDAERAAKSHP